EVAVLEMGMRGRGEIAELSEIAVPDAAVITVIGESHMEQLGSRKEIARAKAEILDGMRAGSCLFYKGDEPLLEEVLAEKRQAGQLPASLELVRFVHSDCNEIYP